MELVLECSAAPGPRLKQVRWRSFEIQICSHKRKKGSFEILPNIRSSLPYCAPLYTHFRVSNQKASTDLTHWSWGRDCYWKQISSASRKFVSTAISFFHLPRSSDPQIQIKVENHVVGASQALTPVGLKRKLFLRD